jgi:mannan endo-1,4-beta-mannosidase
VFLEIKPKGYPKIFPILQISGVFFFWSFSSSYTREIDRMVAGNGLYYPILGFASFVAFIYMSFGDFILSYHKEAKFGFVGRNGTHFVLDGGAFYINGWNSYWLMDHAVDEYSRPRIRAMLKAGANMGLTVCRTWAFNDGAYNSLQISPGQFDERVFQVL